MATVGSLSKTKVKKLIFLYGIRSIGYTVHVSKYDGCCGISVPSVRVGNAIVRAMREIALAKPSGFPDMIETPHQKAQKQKQLTLTF